jgi:hypothetical protein
MLNVLVAEIGLQRPRIVSLLARAKLQAWRSKCGGPLPCRWLDGTDKAARAGAPSRNKSVDPKANARRWRYVPGRRRSRPTGGCRAAARHAQKNVDRDVPIIPRLGTNQTCVTLSPITAPSVAFICDESVIMRPRPKSKKGGHCAHQNSSSSTGSRAMEVGNVRRKTSRNRGE